MFVYCTLFTVVQYLCIGCTYRIYNHERIYGQFTMLVYRKLILPDFLSKLSTWSAWHATIFCTVLYTVQCTLGWVNLDN